jgi:hypothetical protein
VDADAAARGAGGYAEGDYGDAGTTHEGGVPEGQATDYPEGQDAVQGPTDNDEEGRTRGD